MKKKFNHYVSLGLLLLSVLPFSLVSAETVEEVPTGETTISSMADDPLKELKEKAANQVPTIESTPESESVEDTPTNESETKEDVPKTEDTTETKPKPQTRGGGIGPQTVNLIEGVDIDAGFAQLLRTDKSVTNGGGAWSGYGKGANQLTDDDMANLISVFLYYEFFLTSLKGIEYAVNLTGLAFIGSQVSEIDVTKNVALKNLHCYKNQLTELDVTKNTELISLKCYDNQLSELDVMENTALTELECSTNQLTELDVTKNTALIKLGCIGNQLTELDVMGNTALTELDCSSNQLSELDVTKNTALIKLSCTNNQLTELDTTKNTVLTEFHCNNNQLSEIDVTKNTTLIKLDCSSNQLSELDVTKNTVLTGFYCSNNELGEIDVAKNTALTVLDCSGNQIADISSAYNLSNLSTLVAYNQSLFIPVPPVSSFGETVVDLLKTTAATGLSVTNGNITPPPIINYNGNQILLSNVTRESLSYKFIEFQYDGSQLSEGASSGYKEFSGSITFFSVSDLASELKPDRKKVKSGGKVEWTWTIASLTLKKAESIRATLDTLPSGVVIDPSSVKKDGISTSINDLYGTSLGDLNYGESMVLTFETTVTGNVDEWIELKGLLDWEDDTISSPHHNETDNRVQVHDDEQTYTPKDSHDMAIQSVPVYFNHGTNPIMSTAQTYHLHAMNYQSNTKVVTDGFYTRIKDDRAISTGWKLTAKLSDFKDSSNQPMPNGTGTMLKLENMSIERVTDRDTPQEVIDPTPSGADVPSSVQATETLVAGQSTAKTIVSAQMNEGQDTWQLRMPFDKVSLSIPANAGKKKTVYKANLTWSLDDTP